jgi:hypothetical protein
MVRSMTLEIFSELATEVPPNFKTCMVRGIFV